MGIISNQLTTGACNRGGKLIDYCNSAEGRRVHRQPAIESASRATPRAREFASPDVSSYSETKPKQAVKRRWTRLFNRETRTAVFKDCFSTDLSVCFVLVSLGQAVSSRLPRVFF